MKNFFILSAVGKDRPGLVNKITHAINQLGGNIELQRSSRMASEFAMLVLFSTGENRPDLFDRIRELNSDSLHVNVRSAISGTSEKLEAAHYLHLTASGADQPGIVDAVTMVLFKESINIESMDYDTESAPMSGEHLFRLKARLMLPDDLDIGLLRSRLRELEEEYNFDILLEP